jgi:hypothetical protein
MTTPAPNDDDDGGWTPGGVADPFVTLVCAAIGALIIGRGLASNLTGFIDLSGLGYVAAGAGFATFVPFLFWFDADLIRRRAGEAFATTEAALGVMIKVALLATGATVVCGPVVLGLGMGFGAAGVGAAQGFFVMATAGILVVAVIGAARSVRARRALRRRAASDAPPP